MLDASSDGRARRRAASLLARLARLAAWSWVLPAASYTWVEKVRAAGVAPETLGGFAGQLEDNAAYWQAEVAARGGAAAAHE